MQRALGGADRIAAIHDFEQLVSAQTWDRHGHPRGPVRKRTRWIKANLLRLDQVGRGDTYVLYFDGVSGWEILPGKHLTDLAGGELEFARKYLGNFRLNLLLADRNSDFEIGSPAENVLRISNGKTGDQQDLTLDPATWLPVREAAVSYADPGHPVPSETRIEEWMTVAGVRFPRRWSIWHGGVRQAEITAERTRCNGGLVAGDLAAKPGDLDPVLGER